jgi:hypothetical protein
MSELPDNVAALAALLPHMKGPPDAHIMIDLHAKDAETRRLVQVKLGPAYQVIMGYPTGHYILSLGKPEHRLCAMLLMQVEFGMPAHV